MRKLAFTTEEALPIAHKFARHIKKASGVLHLEKPAWHDAQYRTTFFRQVGAQKWLYEIQSEISLHPRLMAFVTWLAAKRHYAELYLVTDGAAQVPASTFSELRAAGIGLIILQDNTFRQTLKAANPALTVHLDPTLKLGNHLAAIEECVTKFNNDDRKDGLRDMCELVERETEMVLQKSVAKRWITLSLSQVKSKDWSDQINCLASKGIMVAGKEAFIDSKLRDDLHSFRGARNLMDHKTTSKKEEVRRQKQFAERMMMGPRLISDLLEVKRKIK